MRSRAERDYLRTHPTVAVRRYRVGQRVLLRANKKEGWEREGALIASIDRNRGTLTVYVDPHDEYDDGLREITPGQINRVLEKNEEAPMTLDQQLFYINEHRRATGHRPFRELTAEQLKAQLALIVKHAPLGNDPWSR